jgi:Tol biopolymer transport system component
MSHRFALEAEEAAHRGLTTSRRLTHDAPGPGGEGPSPRFFRDGTVVFLRQNTNHPPAYVRLDLRTGAQQEISEMQGAAPAAPTPDGRALVFERRSLIPLTWRISGSAYADWRDLFRLDVETGTIRPLTKAWRAHEPDVSPDGTQIACVVASGGPRQLALVPIEGGAPRVLTPGAAGFAYTPAFSPDGKLIAYSRWKPGGFRDIHIYELATGHERVLAVDRAMDVDPRFTPDGRYLLYSSDRTGIYDVYAYELATERLFQVTNVLGGAFQPVVSPDGATLVYSGFDSDGFDLYATRFDPARFLPAQPFANSRLDASPQPDDESDSPDAAPGDAAGFATQTHVYEPWRYMYPRTWNLRFYTVSPFGPGDSVYIDTTLSDPVGNHALVPALLLSGELDPSVSVYYAYNRLWPSFAVSARRAAVERNDLLFGGTNVNYRQHQLGVSAAVGLPVLQTADASANVSFGYDYTAYGPANPFPVADPTGPATIPPERGPDADVYAQWSFSNAHGWPYSISGQEGRSISLFLRIADPALGGRFRTTEVSWAWTEYVTPPWAQLHAFAFLLAGGVGIGDKRQLFPLGGLPEQDVLRAVFLNQREQGLFLRGYQPNSFVGDSYQVLSTEYRAPLVWIEHGYQTFPLYLRRLWGTLFTDVGNSYFGDFNPRQLKVGAGAELHVQFNVFYFVESDVKIGYAHGFQATGIDQIYVVAAASF